MGSKMPPDTTERAIIIFVKYPTPGTVKTRLAAGVGPSTACHMYKACAEHTVRVACRCLEAKVWVAYAPVEGGDTERQMLDLQMRLWLDPLRAGCSYIEQASDNDLGRRMAGAMQDILDSGVKQVILIGSDCPDMDGTVLKQAFAALETYDVVFGPALDGGYYLIGLSRPPGTLFTVGLQSQGDLSTLVPFNLTVNGTWTPTCSHGIQWSTSNTLQQNINQAQALGWSCAPSTCLTALQDLDTLQDLKAWLRTSTATHALHKAFVQLLSQAGLQSEIKQPP